MAERHKRYYEKNKELVKAKSRAYYHSMTLEQRAAKCRRQAERRLQQKNRSRASASDSETDI